MNRRRLLGLTGGAFLGSLGLSVEETVGAPTVSSHEPFEQLWTQAVTDRSQGQGSGFDVTYDSTRDVVGIAGWTSSLGDVTSDTQRTAVADNDGLIAELDPRTGTIRSRYIINDPTTNYLGSILPYSPRGYVVSVAAYGDESYRPTLMAVDEGEQIWKTVLGDFFTSDSIPVIIPFEDGYVWYGDREPTDGAGLEGSIYRLSNRGDILWSAAYGRTLSGAVPTSSEIVAVGSDGQPEESRGLILRLNSNGRVLWDRRIRPPDATDVTFNEAAATTRGGSVVAADVDDKAVVYEFSSSGSIEWRREIPPSLDDESATEVTPLFLSRVGDDEFLVGGVVEATPDRPWFAVLTQGGTLRWYESQRYGLANFDTGLNDVVQAGNRLFGVGYAAELQNDDADYESDERGATWATAFASSNRAPSAEITVSDTTPRVGETVEFQTQNVFDVDGSVTGVEWDLDGDGAFEAGGRRLTRTYESAGTYQVTLRVRDDDGAVTEVSRTLEVVGRPTASDVDISIENNFRTDKAHNWPEYILDEAVDMFSFGDEAEPNSSYGFANFDLTVSFDDPDAYDIRTVRPKFTAPDLDRPYGTDLTLPRKGRDTFEQTNIRFQSPVQYGLQAFQVVTVATTATGGVDSSVVSPQIDKAVDAANSGYPDVTLDALIVEYGDGAETTIDVDREIPKFTDVCPGIDMLKWTSERCDDLNERLGPTAAMTFSPATVALEDADGNVTGRIREEGELIEKNEIPGAVWSGPVEHEFVIAPEGEHTVRVTGTDEGKTTIKVDNAVDDTERPFQMRIYEDIAVERGVVATTETGDTGLTVKGVYGGEDSVSPTKQLSLPAEEYAAGVNSKDPSVYLNSEFGGGSQSDSDATKTISSTTDSTGTTSGTTDDTETAGDDGPTDETSSEDGSGVDIPIVAGFAGLLGAGGGGYLLARARNSDDQRSEDTGPD